MSRRYAVLGWGSLIWDLEILTPHVRLPWARSGGPRLPVEFSRISPKRKNGLVLCLDADAGATCATSAVLSVRTDLGAVIADLAARERASTGRIGGVCLETGAVHGRAPVTDIVRDWCREAGWTGAVWTDLPANFAEKTGTAFTLARAVAYLKTRTGENLDEAVRYIEEAPCETDTPLRRLLAVEPWWQAQAARMAGAVDPELEDAMTSRSRDIVSA